MTAEVHAITCQSCGGAVALEAGRRLPRCLYCGSEALVEAEVDERVEPPVAFIPFALSDAEADDVFRKFTRSSIWYPNEIRQARLKLSRLMLPAWTWSGEVESHYAALVKAPTRSGKRPQTGSDVAQLQGVLVPSSTALSRAELAGISPFHHKDEQPFDPGAIEEPWEPGRLTRTAAREAAVEAMEAAHRDLIQRKVGATKLNTAAVCAELSGRPVLLPIYIGAWRYKDRPYRVVINGQTGRLTGKAPISWAKVVLAVLGALALLGFLALLVAAAGVASNL